MKTVMTTLANITAKTNNFCDLTLTSSENRNLQDESDNEENIAPSTSAASFLEIEIKSACSIVTDPDFLYTV